MIAGVCRRCGCTDQSPCILDARGNLVDVADERDLFTLPEGAHPCSWVEPDLCSGCVQPTPPLLFDAGGRPLRGAP